MAARDIIELIGLVLFGTGGGILGSILYFRPKLRKEKADATIHEVEAKDKKHDYLEERLDKMEKLYAQQGGLLDNVRKEMLEVMEKLGKVEQENVHLRMENTRLRQENTELKAEIGQLRQDFNSYKNSKS